MSGQLNPAYGDFRNFLTDAWEHLGLPEPTPVQYDIAWWMQYGDRREITEAFRGVGKSFIAGAFAAWNLMRDPQIKILIVSASKDRADAQSIFIKRMILEMPCLRFLAPKDEQRTSNIAFDVGPAVNDQSPSVKSVGITGQITGSRADIIIPDDVESLNNSGTNDQRMKLGERIKEFDAVIKPGGRIMYLGTPQTEFSIYVELVNRGYTVRIWPALYPTEDQQSKYGEALAPIIRNAVVANPKLQGTTTDPIRFSDIDLRERRVSYGRAGFALQFMLDTQLSDADRYPLKLSDLPIMRLDQENGPGKVVWGPDRERILNHLPNVGLKGDILCGPMDVLKPFGPYTGCVMAIDPSGRGKDETGYAIIKIRNGTLYLVSVGGLQGGYDVPTLEALAALAKTYKVNEVVIEDNFGDGMYAELFKPVMVRAKWPVTVTGMRSTGQKELRIIDTLEPVMSQHRLVVDEAVFKDDLGGVDEDGALKRNPQKSFGWQLTRITKDRGALMHDDRIDAVAIAVAYWVEAMARDVDQAQQEALDELLDKDLEDFMEHIITGLDRELVQ